MALLLAGQVMTGLAGQVAMDRPWSRAVTCVSTRLDAEREIAAAAMHSNSNSNSSLSAVDSLLLDSLEKLPCRSHSMQQSDAPLEAHSLKICHSRAAELQQNSSTLSFGTFTRDQWSNVARRGLAWQWLTLKNGMVVRSLVQHYMGGGVCPTSGRPRVLHTFTYCREEMSATKSSCRPHITWAGVDDGLRAHNMASWMRYSTCYDCPGPAEACGLRVHIALPANCPVCANEKFKTLRDKIQRYYKAHALVRALKKRKHKKAQQKSAKLTITDEVQAQGGKQTLTYGEILLEGTLRIADVLGLGLKSTERINIYDLGSGEGGFCALLSMLCEKCRAVVGIELMPDRHHAAVATHTSAVQAGLLREEEAERLELRLGDALSDTAFRDATHIYIASTCFSPAMFKKFLASLAVSVDVRCLISLKPVPPKLLLAHNHRQRNKPTNRQQQQYGRGGGSILEMVAKVAVPTSWSLRATAYIYAAGGSERCNLDLDTGVGVVEMRGHDQKSTPPRPSERASELRKGE